jgi:mannose-1-phosphate guanylyltransferase
MSSSKAIHVQPVVMAGGSGTRLWPLSRAAYPKQFLVLTTDNKTLYQQAVERIERLAGDRFDVARPITVGTKSTASWSSTSCVSSASRAAPCCLSLRRATPRRR